MAVFSSKPVGGGNALLTPNKAQAEDAGAADTTTVRATMNNSSSNSSSSDPSAASSSSNDASSSPPEDSQQQPQDYFPSADKPELPQTPSSGATRTTTCTRTRLNTATGTENKDTVNAALSSTCFGRGSSTAFTVAEEAAVSSTETMPEDFARKLVSQIHRKLDSFLSNSSYVESNSQLHKLPRFEYGGLPLGEAIAKGGFSQIVEVIGTAGINGVSLLSAEEGNDEHSKPQYVVKSLSTKLALKKLPGATKDIVFEAHTLSALNHENIIKLRGLSMDGIDGFQNTRSADGFFLVFDRLGDTLFQRVYQWQNELLYQGRYKGLKKKQISIKQIKREQFIEKIGIVVDVAAALAYCHERRIMHRDIKSANVAFDPRRGNKAVLIDFGLATELPAYDPVAPNRVYQLTGNIGTARYMDPAVIMGENYNEKADVHSFAVLCWECCAGKKPYSNLDAKKVKDHVSKWNERPKVYWSWPRKLKQIMQKGWAKRQEDRPSMAEFHKALVKVQRSLPASNIDLAALQQQHQYLQQ